MHKREDIQIRDPFVLVHKEDGKYYLFGTTDRNPWNQEGTGFEAWVSGDLENFEGPFPVFTPPKGFWGTHDFWAPEIHPYGDRYYLFASFTSPDTCRGTQILVSHDILGPFLPLSDGAVTPADWECLDGTLYADGTGKPWIVFCHEWVQAHDGAIYAMPLSEDLKNPAGGPELLFRASAASWSVPRERRDGSGLCDARVTDGPFLHRQKDGTLVMLWSSIGEQGYAMGCALSRSGSLLGPWEQTPEPLISRDGGHGMVFRDFSGDLRLTWHGPNSTPHERFLHHRVEESDQGLILAGGIDRTTLVRRHNPVVTNWDPRSPLSVGNGDFTFTADVTGLQSFGAGQTGDMPLCTMSQWGWHAYPDAPADDRDLRREEFACGGRTVGYMTDPQGQESLYDGLRRNPHRFHLGKIGLSVKGKEELNEADLTETEQILDLWTGRLSSSFTLKGRPVRVQSVCHPQRDLLSFRIESPLIGEGALGLDLRFPYPSHEKEGADWSAGEKHFSVLEEESPRRFRINRKVDSLEYAVSLRFAQDARFVPAGVHRWSFSGDGSVMEFSLEFSRDALFREIPLLEETAAESARRWKSFWTGGAALSFKGSRDPRAGELERRIILSQYLLALQSMGSLPPAETGLTCNSWYGKFHLEMHIWHALNGILWNRGDLVEKSLAWYEGIIPSARERAVQQGYRGIRWPKMTDPEGRDSPSPIGTLLCWQQPHIILFAELLYRRKREEAVLEKYGERVFLTADFMADYALWDEDRGEFILGPPVIPAQENHRPEETINPTFELEYWRWGLKTALLWKKRLKQPSPGKWREVLDMLSPCPLEKDTGRYKAHGNCVGTYGAFAADHPAMLFALGLLPGESIDREAMSRSFDGVRENWRCETMWGWDFPAAAMTLARLGRRKEAVDFLLAEADKNCYMANGHNRQVGSEALPLYLPGNGGLLLAAAMMAAGWEGSTGEAPGFPDDGSWKVRQEGLEKYI
ncbi:MAG: family 43 glycosylhydrolase [Spirochaetales bacterium]|nr:family 43 glycosylhydrolase [Spirochaetales bacterium]